MRDSAASPVRRWLVGAALLLAQSTAGAAFGQVTAAPPASPSAATASGCPGSNEVREVLATLLPPPDALAAAGAARLEDLGENYRVAVGEADKTYRDPDRDCARRARVAAAFIALVVAPVAVPEDAPDRAAPDRPRDASAAPAVPAALTPTAARSPGPFPELRLDARGALAVAPSVGLVAPGGAIGAALAWARVGARVECGWLASTEMDVSGGDGGSVALERFPCSLGAMVRLVRARRAVEVDAAAGLAAGAIVVSGRGFASSRQSARLEVGARAGLDAVVPIGSGSAGLAAIVGVDARYDPLPYDLDVTPRGAVGQTPSFWAGVTAGVCWTVE